MYAKITLLAAATALSACSGHMMMKTPEAPAAVTVPAGNKVVMKTVGIGELTYQCRAKANMTGAFEWVLAGPDAILYDGNKMAVGKYYGGPTWEANDGSKVTGKQLAVSPNPDSIPLQLVQANPSMGKGAMSDITYIQRLNTVGGAAPATPCGAANVNAKQIVKYQADYVFYRASM